MKKILIILLSLLPMFGMAQISNTKVMFFVFNGTEDGSRKAKSLNNPDTYIQMYQFKDGKMYLTSKKIMEIRKNLLSDKNYYSNIFSGSPIFANIHWYMVTNPWGVNWTSEWVYTTYSSDYSNEKWYVYKIHYYPVLMGPIGQEHLEGNSFDCFFAFSKDFKQIKQWHEPDVVAQGDGRCGVEKYRRVTVEEIISANPQKEFLR